MRALVIERPGVAAVDDLPYPAPGPGEVTIQVKRCGICGTDKHIFERESIFTPYPLVPGHEFSGIIHQVGIEVADFRIGDRVTVDPSRFCGTCAFCMTGRWNHCLRRDELNRHKQGAMAEYVKAPVANVYHLPDHVSFAEGALVEPLACVVQAINHLHLHAGYRALVFGCGGMGQLLIQALAHAGVSELAVVDVSDDKLSLAQRFGATAAYRSTDLPHALASRLHDYDVVVDATGIPSVIASQFDYLAPRGTHLQFGVAPKDAAIPIRPFDIYYNEWTLVGSIAVNHTFKPALDWIAAGRIDVRSLVSTVIPLELTPDVLSVRTESGRLKVHIGFD